MLSLLSLCACQNTTKRLKNVPWVLIWNKRNMFKKHAYQLHSIVWNLSYTVQLLCNSHPLASIKMAVVGERLNISQDCTWEILKNSCYKEVILLTGDRSRRFLCHMQSCVIWGFSYFFIWYCLEFSETFYMVQKGLWEAY